MTKKPHANTRSARPIRPALAAAMGGLALLTSAPAAYASASAAPLAQVQGWRRWWLPENYSVHGGKIDLLFNVIFVVTAAVGVAVFFFLIKYCIQYRHRPGMKAHFSHGNRRLEMIWTIVPAVLLLGLALWSKGAWDDYRYSPTSGDPNRAQMMVIAEQFNWNVIYPGADGKVGRYLVYPQTTDLKWPAMPPGEDPNAFASQYNVPGPAYLPQAKALEALNGYVSTINPLGKDFADEAGKDDDWVKFPGRPIHVPKGRPVEIHLSSKDVLHSFALPDFRVKLDAVPGMKGLIYFEATKTSAEFEQASRREYTLDELEALVGVKYNAPDMKIVVPADPAAAANYVYVAEQEVMKTVRGRRQKVVEKTDVQVKDGDPITPDLVKGMKAKGALTKVQAYTTKAWDLVCEELCGNGHTSMRGRLIVLDADEYARRFEGKGATPPPAGPATAPTASAAGPQ